MFNQRPDDVKAAIERAYAKLATQDSSNWGLRNGKNQTGYGICNVDDFLVIEKIILAGLMRGQTTFNFMDVGAGEFNWGRGVAKFINNHPLFREKGITVNIYSLRGEAYEGQVKTPQGNCTLYEYGKFAVENLISEFEDRQHQLTGSVDLIVSSWCFIHLVDPLGTSIQCLELLRSETGIMFIEGFVLEIQNSSLQNFQRLETDDLLKLFSLANLPCFMQKKTFGRSLNDFVVRKSNTPLRFPLEYQGIKFYGEGIERAPLTSFNATAEFETLLESVVVVEHKVGHTKYFTNENSQASGHLLNWVLSDHAELAAAYSKKLVLLCQLDVNDPPVIEDFYSCLSWLIKNNPDKALEIIDQKLRENKPVMESLFNRVPLKAFQLLSDCMKGNNPIELFQKLVEISSRETLNTKFKNSNLTLLMEACFLAGKEATHVLLQSKKVDTSISTQSALFGDADELTALRIIEKQNLHWPDIIAKLKEVESSDTPTSPGRNRSSFLAPPSDLTTTTTGQTECSVKHTQINIK